MNPVRQTISVLLAVLFAGMAMAQSDIEKLRSAPDEAALIQLHQQLGIPRGDVNGDGDTSFADLLWLIDFYGQSGGGYLEADLNLDGETNLADFAILSYNFGQQSYQAEPSPRPRRANLGLWQDDNGKLVISSTSEKEIGAIEIDFMAATPGGLADVATGQFSFFIPGGERLIGFGSLGRFEPFEGDFATGLSSTSTDIKISWTEPGSYEIFSLGYGVGDPLTNRAWGEPLRFDELLDPVDPGAAVANNFLTDTRFDEVSSVSELVALHQDADVPRGDFNANGDVQFDDFLHLALNFKATSSAYSDGDANLDRIVDLKDFAILSTNFGSSGYSPDPPIGKRVSVSATIGADRKVVISAGSPVELGGLAIESSNAGLVGVEDTPAPFELYLESNNQSVTMGSLGSGTVLVTEPITTSVIAAPNAQLTVQWFQRGSYEVFSTIVGSVTMILGDIDKSGDVGFADFLMLAERYGEEAGAGEAVDVDQDGLVGFSDFLIVAKNFGLKTEGSVAVVPETAINAMLTSLFIITLCFRKRRHM